MLVVRWVYKSLRCHSGSTRRGHHSVAMRLRSNAARRGDAHPQADPETSRSPGPLLDRETLIGPDTFHLIYGAQAEGVIGCLAAHLLAAPSRLTRADRMCRVELVKTRRPPCSDF